MTTHLCLLSDHPIANLTPLLDARLEANRVMFLTSPQQRDKLARMRTVLGPRGIQVEALEIDDAMDYPAILSTLDGFLRREQERGTAVLINVSGGTRPMAIAAHMAGFNGDVPVFHVWNDHVHWLENADGERQPFAIEERLKLPEYLAAHGFTMESRNTGPVPAKHLALFEDMLTIPAFHEQIKTLNYLAWQAENSSLSVRLDSGHEHNASLQALLDRLADADLVEFRRGALTFTSEASRDLCNGLWIEEFCYREAEKLKGELGRKLQDFTRGLAIRGRGHGREPVDNELDLALLYDNRFYLIECKTRNFTDQGDPDVEATLYKLAALRRNVGGIHGKSMLVSAYPIRDKHKRRAAALDIEIVDGASAVANFQALLKDWLV